MPHFINENCVGCVLCLRYCPVDAISGKKRQLHVINPAICIDCGVCGKVCAFKAVVDSKNQLVLREKPAEWVRPVFDYAKCVACNLCNMVCPPGVIGAQTLDGQKRKDILPFLESSECCIGCSFCAEICPTGAIAMQGKEKTRQG